MYRRVNLILWEDVVVAGPVETRLRAALSATDGTFVVRLMDVAADGSSTPVASGVLRASHRESHAHEVDVPEGELVDYDIEVADAHWRFQAGHRLRLAVVSGDVPRLAPEAPPGTVTVEVGESGSHADVWVRGDGATLK